MGGGGVQNTSFQLKPIRHGSRLYLVKKGIFFVVLAIFVRRSFLQIFIEKNFTPIVDSDTIDMYSTYVPSSLEGRGIGKLLADQAFQLAKERGLTIRPTCWYLAGYLRRQD